MKVEGKNNYRTNGPVNAYLATGPGIYLNAFIHVFSHRARADNPLGTNADVNRKPLSLCLFVASLKKRNLILYTFLMILYMYIAPGKGQTIPWGQTFDVNRMSLTLCSFVAGLKSCCEVRFYIHFFFMFNHIYIASGWGRQSIGDKILMTTERPLPFAHMLQVSKWSKSDFIHILNNFIHVYSPGARAENLLGTNFWCQQKALITLPIRCKFKKWNLILYTFLMILYMLIAPEQGQTTPWGQTFDVNRKPLSLCPFVAGLKKTALKSDFMYIFSCFTICI